VAGMRRYQFFDVGDFMIMCRILRPPRPSLVLYKHYYTADTSTSTTPGTPTGTSRRRTCLGPVGTWRTLIWLVRSTTSTCGSCPG
jgi:hypothetical protein